MARLIVAIVSLVVLIVFLFVFPDESRIISLCTGLVAAVVVISFVRYRQACHQVREEQVG